MRSRVRVVGDAACGGSTLSATGPSHARGLSRTEASTSAAEPCGKAGAGLCADSVHAPGAERVDRRKGESRRPRAPVTGSGCKGTANISYTLFDLNSDQDR